MSRTPLMPALSEEASTLSVEERQLRFAKATAILVSIARRVDALQAVQAMPGMTVVTTELPTRQPIAAIGQDRTDPGRADALMMEDSASDTAEARYP